MSVFAKSTSTVPLATAILSGLNTREDVAALLGITDRSLRYTLYGAKERTKYRRFEIRKRDGGARHIAAPPKKLAILQRKLATILIDVHAPKPSAHGFLRGRSVATNARPHLGQRHVLNVDVEAFFPSIHFGRFRAILKAPPFKLGDIAARVIAQICFDDAGVLPQGAPSSPIVSNIVARGLDDRNQRLAKRHRCQYTRYADDVTFSTSQRLFPRQLASIDETSGQTVCGDELLSAFTDCGFRLNPRKTRLQSVPRRRVVTGLTVNEMPNVSRDYVREIDSILHCWRRNGPAIADEVYRKKQGLGTIGRDHLKHVLLGKLGFLEMAKGVDDPVVRRLRWGISDILASPNIAPRSMSKVVPTPLRGLTGHFRGWDAAFSRYEPSIYFIAVMRGTEICSSGTGFVIGDNLLATAGHIAERPSLRIGLEEPYLVPTDRRFVNKPGEQDIGLLKFDGSPFAGIARLPFQFRLPMIGEVAGALGYPSLPFRHFTKVFHSGWIEALPIGYKDHVFIQTSFPSGGGLSGAPLIDRRGFVLGVMVENVFPEVVDVPPKPYGQASPFEYLARLRREWETLPHEDPLADRPSAETEGSV